MGTATAAESGQASTSGLKERFQGLWDGFKSRVKAGEEDPKSLYTALKPLARFLKIVGQMLIGLGTAVAVFAAIIMRSRALLHHPGVLSHGVQGAGTLTDDIFAITAVGLAAAAALELAYTLFTPGPDEAINPLLLGVSSTFLFLASKVDKLNWEFGFSAVLVVIALSGLFGLQAIFKKLYPDNNPVSTGATATASQDNAARVAEPSAGQPGSDT